MTHTVKCNNEECENYDFEIELKNYGGEGVICGPCGNVIEEQKEWHSFEVYEKADTVGLAQGLINEMSPEERAELIKALGG